MKKFIAFIVIFLLLSLAGCVTPPAAARQRLVFACTGYPCEAPVTLAERDAAVAEWRDGQKPPDSVSGGALAAWIVAGVLVAGGGIALAAILSNQDSDDPANRVANPVPAK